MTVNPAVAFHNTIISNRVFSNTNNYFLHNLTDYPWTLPITLNSTDVTATVKASFGYQGMADFRINLAES
jgi:hypothetical protein